MSHRRFIAAAAFGAAACLLLSACASATSAGSAPGSPLGAVDPGLPSDDVVGQGTVLDDGSGPQLCLGGVMESYPPQCSGIPLEGWSWSEIDGSESSGGVTWGSYAVQGRFDGKTLTVTQEPVMLALYDPMMQPDPTQGREGTGTDGELAEIQDTIHDRLGSAALSSSAADGWLWIDVVWDDGTWQDAADGEFGPEKIVICSALREVG